MTEVKLCTVCTEPLPNRRFKYHDACRDQARAAALDGQRQCKKCKKIKAATAFSADSTRPDGKFPWCKACQLAHGLDNKWQNPADELNGHACPLCDTPIRGHANRRFCSTPCKDRVASLRKKFALTVEQYRAMVSDANGRCPICQRRCRVWHVDHNHQTRKVTGIVCSRCNVGPLAMTYHDVEFTRRLLAYLEQPTADRLGIEALVPEGENESSQLHRVWNHRARASRPAT